MKISAIMPVYNAEKYLARAMDRLRAQTLKDIEIICIDDGSTDESPAILKQYAARDSRIKIISRKNQGVASARNAGIKAATGDYVHFMDADDEVDADWYETLLAAAAAADADVAAGGFEEEGRRTIIYKTSRVYETMREKFAGTMAVFRGFCWRYLIRRDLIIKNKLKFQDFIVLEDMLFVLEMLRLANRVVSAPGPLYRYRMNRDSCINTTDRARAAMRRKQFCEARILVRNFIRSHGLWHHKLHWWNKLPFGLANRKTIAAG